MIEHLKLWNIIFTFSNLLNPFLYRIILYLISTWTQICLRLQNLSNEGTLWYRGAGLPLLQIICRFPVNMFHIGWWQIFLFKGFFNSEVDFLETNTSFVINITFNVMDKMGLTKTIKTADSCSFGLISSMGPLTISIALNKWYKIFHSLVDN